jgi:hypothetical protein
MALLPYNVGTECGMICPFVDGGVDDSPVSSVLCLLCILCVDSF